MDLAGRIFYNKYMWQPYFHIESLTTDGQWSWRHGPFTSRKLAEEFPLPEIRMPDGSADDAKAQEIFESYLENFCQRLLCGEFESR